MKKRKSKKLPKPLDPHFRGKVPQTSKMEKDELYLHMKQDPLTFLHYFFPHHVPLKSPPFHIQIIDAAMVKDRLAVAAPRGFAKSTILTFLLPLHALTFKRKHFIVIIQSTFKKAAASLDSIKKEMKDVREYKNNWGGIRIVKDAEGDSEFRHPDGFRTKVLCKGRDQIGSLRGSKFGAYRPDMFVIDDVEDDKMVENPMLRDELEQLFDDVIVPAGSPLGFQLIAIGTLLHDASLMAKLVSPHHYHNYYKLFYKALIDMGKETEKSLWPQRMSVDELYRLMKSNPRTFSKEYQNDPVTAGNVKFSAADFRYWRMENNEYHLLNEENRIVGRGYMSNCKAAIACDLAWDETRQSDFTVILPGFLTPQSDILIDDYVCKKGLKPNQVEETLFSMHLRLKSLTNSDVPVGFEKAKLEKVVKWILKEAMRKRNYFMTLKDLIWDGDKISRIETRLEPRYAQHTIYHKQGMGELEHQLTRFPSAAHDDLPDSEQGLVQLLQFPKTVKAPLMVEDDFTRMVKYTKEFNKPRRVGMFGLNPRNQSKHKIIYTPLS